MNSLVSALFKGSVMHCRVRPRRHQLRYRMFYMLLDVDEIDTLDDQLRCFSRNRFNLFSFHDRDHGDGSATPLRDQVRTGLSAAGVTEPIRSLRLMTMPRLLGHVFNPISIFFCHGQDNKLIAMLYEVNNTFGERHTYVVPVEPGAELYPLRQSCDKRLHVSPFMDMDMRYDFRVYGPDSVLTVVIDAGDTEGMLITTAFSGRREVISDATLLRAFFAYPLLTLKVVAAIHWEALRLLLKGVRIRGHKPAPRYVISPATSTSVPLESNRS
jgi:uncharacterized protein